MYKTELIRKVSRETRLSQRVVSDVVNETLKMIVTFNLDVLTAFPDGR